MDGKSPIKVLDQSPHYITAVTLDLDNKRVHWSEQSFHQIKSANYDGSNKQVILKNERGKVYNLLGTTNIAFYNSQLFFYDEAWRTIASISVNEPEHRVDESSYKLIYEWLIVKAMRIVHPSTQKFIVNPCANERCNERQMCFISGKEGASQILGYTCAYPGEASSSGREA